MTNLEKHEQDLYKLRFSPMCKPAGEVSNLSHIESHTTRSRLMMMWRIAAGHLQWGHREVELLYESTLDSISEAFDVFHYPISQYMLDARADVWSLGLTQDVVRNAVERMDQQPSTYPEIELGGNFLLAGEIAQLEDESYIDDLHKVLDQLDVHAGIWVAPSGATAYALGARNVAKSQAQKVAELIRESKVRTVIADGPETAWALTKIYPKLGIEFAKKVEVKLLSTLLAKSPKLTQWDRKKVFLHDSRSACLIADELPNHLAILPGYLADENAFGKGEVYTAPRQFLDALGFQRIYGTWTRALAKSCGVDEGLWLTYPELAIGLAKQRIAYASNLGAEIIATDSPLCASYLAKQAGKDDPLVVWLPRFFIRKNLKENLCLY